MPLQTSQTPTSVFHIRNKSPLDVKIFLDESGTVDISRADLVKYPIFQKQADAMFANFWKPHEIVLTQDKIEFDKDLEDHHRFIFTSNIKRQAMIDSIQSQAITQSFGAVVSDPMVKKCLVFMEFFEELHNAAYQHVIRNVYNDPTKEFNEIPQIDEIVACGKDIGKYYDDFILEIALYRCGLSTPFNVKYKLWLALNSVNALEGIRFFGSFACSWAFANNMGVMMGNASEIQLIAADELLHQAFTTALIRTLPDDDPDFKIIAEACKAEVEAMFYETLRQELKWVDFIFQRGSMIGLNDVILKQYLHWITAKRMRAVFLTPNFEVPRTNPIPWTSKWLNEGEMQKAPQETEVTSYTQDTMSDVSGDTFSGFEL
jgi:ribonucleoside-diphosphate reductase beta chain